MTTVLVIDDEAPIRLLCRVNLEAEGMPVLEAGDGPSGLEAARSETPDVILLDVMMPGLDGWGVAEALLEDERTAEIPIIFLTARAEFRDRAQGARHRRRRLHHEAVQPRRAGAARARAARPARARRARRAPPREADRAPRPDGRDLAAGEVGGDDGRAGVADEVAPERAEADPVQPGRSRLARWPGLAIQPLTTRRAVAYGPVPQARFSPYIGPRAPDWRSRPNMSPWVKTSVRSIVAV